MTDTQTTDARRKKVQAIKISATWTPNNATARIMQKWAFGDKSPVRVRGGRLTLNAAVAIDLTDPSQATQVAERVREIRDEIAAIGTIHTFSTQAGAVHPDDVETLAD